MKFRLQFIDKEFCIQENKINLIVIENIKTYRNIIKSFVFNDFNDENIFLYEGTEILEAKKYLRYLGNITYLNLNKPNLLKKVYKYLEEKAEKYYVDDLECLKSEVFKFIFKIIDDLDYHIDFEKEFNVSKIFESVQINYGDEENSVVDIICEYMDLINRIEHKNIFIFNDLRSLVDEDELRNIYDYSMENKYNLILLEQFLLYDNFEDESVFVLDYDLCEIY